MLLYEVSVSNLFSLPTLHFNNMDHGCFLMLCTPITGIVTFADDEDPLLEYVTERNWDAVNQGLTVKSITQVIHDEIMDKEMYDRDNPLFILCDPELAQALRVKVFRVDMVEDIILPRLIPQEDQWSDRTVRYDQISTAWRMDRARIPLMVCHGMRILNTGTIFPSCEGKRRLSVKFRSLLSAIINNKLFKIAADEFVNFYKIWIAIKPHLRSLPSTLVNSCTLHTEATVEPTYIYDVSQSPLGSYFGARVLSIVQLRGLILYEWANLTSAEGAQIPRCLPITDAEETVRFVMSH